MKGTLVFECDSIHKGVEISVKSRLEDVSIVDKLTLMTTLADCLHMDQELLVMWYAMHTSGITKDGAIKLEVPRHES